MKSNTTIFKCQIICIFFIANAIGDCTGDSFIVSGTNNNVPMICGENSGQHSKFPLHGLLFLGYGTSLANSGSLPGRLGMILNCIVITEYPFLFQFFLIWRMDVLLYIST